MLRSIISREQFSLTKAFHGAAWNTSAAGLQVLRSRLGCGDLNRNWAKQQAQLGRNILAPWNYNFNTCARPMGKDKCGSQEKQKYHCMVAGVSLEEYGFGQMSNQQWEKPDLPQLKPGSLPTTSQIHFFAHDLHLKSFYTLLAGGCPTVVILVQPYLL